MASTSKYSSYNCLTSWDSYDKIPRYVFGFFLATRPAHRCVQTHFNSDIPAKSPRHRPLRTCDAKPIVGGLRLHQSAKFIARARRNVHEAAQLIISTDVLQSLHFHGWAAPRYFSWITSIINASVPHNAQLFLSQQIDFDPISHFVFCRSKEYRNDKRSRHSEHLFFNQNEIKLAHIVSSPRSPGDSLLVLLNFYEIII